MMSSDSSASRRTIGSNALSLTAAAAIIGPLAYVAVTLLHPPGIANDHPATFQQYAMDHYWIAIHLAQLVAMVIGFVGIGGISASMFRLQDKGGLIALIAVVLAAVSIPIAAVLQSVDGIALKRAVDAWVAEGGTVGSPSFAAARAIRWVEEGLNAILGLIMGWTVVLAAVSMLRGAIYPRWMGLTGAAIGIAVLISAIFVAETGFSPSAQVWVLARNPGLWLWTAVAGALMWRRLRLHS